MELAIDKVDPMATAQWMMENGMLKDGTTLRATIGDERYARVSKEAERLGIPMEAADMLQPWVLGLQLVEMQYMQLGFDPQKGVEQQLEHGRRRTENPSVAWKRWMSSSASCRACRTPIRRASSTWS